MTSITLGIFACFAVGAVVIGLTLRARRRPTAVEAPMTFNGKPYTVGYGGIVTRDGDRWTQEEVAEVLRREAPALRLRQAHLDRRRWRMAKPSAHAHRPTRTNRPN